MNTAEGGGRNMCFFIHLFRVSGQSKNSKKLFRYFTHFYLYSFFGGWQGGVTGSGKSKDFCLIKVNKGNQI